MVATYIYWRYLLYVVVGLIAGCIGDIIDKGN